MKTKMDRYRQCELHHANTRMTCWLDVITHPVRVGSTITLKDDPVQRRWVIAAMSQLALSSVPEMKWQVGGLA